MVLVLPQPTAGDAQHRFVAGHSVRSGMASTEPLPLDLADFDAVGITADVVATVRSHAVSTGVDSSAVVSAPDAWHRVVVNCGSTGSTVLRVRFTDLTRSRANNVSSALVERGWQLDEDGDGASSRHLPGVEAATIAFDVLGAVALGGAPSDVRTVTANDREGTPIAL